MLDKAAIDLGLNFTAVTARPTGMTYKLTKPRIGLWDQYGGSMPSGHVRWLLEQFEFDFERRLSRTTLDAGNLKAKYDVLLFPDGGIPEDGSAAAAAVSADVSRAASEIPEEYRAHLGRVTIKSTVPKLKEFAEAGGVIVAFGGSAVLGEHLGLPVSDHLVEVAQDGSEKPLPGTKFYIPGSIMSVAVDNTNPLAFGFEKKVDVFFDSSPVMELAPNASLTRHQAGGVVRLEEDAALGLGVGPALSRWRHRRRRSDARQGQGVPVRTGDHVPRAAARHVQVPVQRIFYGTARPSAEPRAETAARGRIRA